MMDSLKKRSYIFFIAPALIWVFLFSVYPFFYALYISFTNMNLLKLRNPAALKFVGFQNYAKLFSDPEFFNSFELMLIFTFAVILFQFVFGFLLALLLKETARGTRIVRTAVMLPWVVPPVALALIWSWIWRSGQLGLINSVLVLFRIHPVDWLGFDRALFSVIATTVWVGVPFSFMIELASLQKIPVELYESASVDGASALGKLFRITVPMIRSTFMINLIMITIGTIGYFDIVYALTKGGPQNATEVLPLYMYRLAFRNSYLGRGSAVAMVMLVVCILTTLLYLILFKAGREEWNE